MKTTIERFLLVKWIGGEPVLNGAIYADTKEELIAYYNLLPKVKGVEYTICSIYSINN